MIYFLVSELASTQNPDSGAASNPVGPRRGEVILGKRINWADYKANWWRGNDLKVVDRFKHLLSPRPR